MNKIITRHQSLICSNCYNITNYDMKLTFKDINEDDHAYGVPVTTRILHKCPHCEKRTQMWDVDREIAKSVILMNLQGFETIFSCQGHIEKYGRKYSISTPYIFVDGGKYMTEELLNDLIKIGFIDWTVGRGKGNLRHMNLRLKKDRNIIIYSNTFAFHYNMRLISEQYDKLKDQYNCDMNKVVQEMDKIYKKINKALEKVLIKHYKEYSHDENLQALQG